MAVLYCIRHGQSASNAGEVTESPESIPLTALGRNQAELVAAAFGRQPRQVIVSPFDRAQATAEPLCRRFPEVPRLVRPVQEFTYLAPARYHGTRRSDRAEAVAAYWRKLDPESIDGPGAENFVGFWARVEDFLWHCQKLTGLVAVFSHGQFLRGVLLRLLCGPLETTEAMTRFRGFRQGLPMPNVAMVKVFLAKGVCRVSPVLIDHVPPGQRST